MSLKLFLDTSAWCALFDKSDQFHRIGSDFFASLKGKPVQFYTTDFVFAESLTLIRFNAGHKRAVEFGEHFRRSGLRLIDIAPEQKEEAWEIFVKYQDQEFSYVDCASFAVMKNLGLRKCFTFDRHFSIFGFEVLPPSRQGSVLQC